MLVGVVGVSRHDSALQQLVAVIVCWGVGEWVQCSIPQVASILFDATLLSSLDTLTRATRKSLKAVSFLDKICCKVYRSNVD